MKAMLPAAFENMINDRIVYSILIMICIFSSGTQGVISVILLDIAEITHSTTKMVSFGLNVSTCGSAICSLCIGWLVDRRISREMAFAFSSAGLGISFMVLTMTSSINVHFIGQFFNGFFLSSQSITSFSWIIEIWMPDQNPPMQALFLMTALGSAVAPVIIKPFMSSVTTIQSVVNGQPQVGHFQESRIQIPCAILSILTILLSCLLLVILWRRPYSKKVNDNKGSDEGDKSPCDYGDTSFIMKCCSCLMLAFYMIVQKNTISFLSVFVVFCGLHLDKETAASITAIHGTITAIALGMNFLSARWISNSNMVLSGLMITMFGTLMMLLAATCNSPTLLYASVIVNAYGQASVLPSMYSFVTGKMFISNTMYGFINLSQSLFSLLPPFITGHLIEDDALVFVYLNGVGAMASLLIAILLRIKF